MKYLLLACSIFGAMLATAQPINDDCVAAVSFGEAPYCSAAVYDNTNATASSIASTTSANLPSCWASVTNDVWFSFVVPLDGSAIDFQVILNAVGADPIGNPSIAVYRGECSLDGLDEVACAATLTGETEVTVDLVGLTPGFIYYIRVQDNSTTAADEWGTFTLCVNLPPVATIEASASSDTLCTNVLSGVTLTATGDDFVSYQWTPANLCITPNAATTNLLALTQTTTFMVTGTMAGDNLIVNGDFEQGNTGFTSGLTNVAAPSGGMCQGCYQITNMPPSQWTQCADHTPAPGVNQLVSNGAITAGVNVWCQTVNVTPQTSYVFSGWVQTLNTSSPPNMQFSVNGTPIGNGASTFNCNWVNLSYPWNSGTSSTANLCIVNLNISPNGNDFGLDDLFFGAVTTVTDEVTVYVNPLQIEATQVAPDDCTLDCTGSAFATITPGLGVTTMEWSSGNTSEFTTGMCAGTYTVTATDGTCTVTATTLIEGSAFVASATSTNNPCAAAANGEATAYGQFGFEPYTYQWDNGSNTQTATFSTAGLHTVTISDVNGCSDTASVFVVFYPEGYVATISPDDTVCLGTTVTLTASAPDGSTLVWDNGSMSPDLTFQPGSTATYYVVARRPTSENLVVNGDFEAGNVGFTTGYNLGTGGSWGLLSLEGTYGISTSPSNLHVNFADCSDVTTGSGNMLVVNGSNVPNTNVWCEVVNVVPYTEYAFSAWLASVVASNPAVLQFNINGIPIGGTFTANTANCDWANFSTVWNSDINTMAQICIVNQSVAVSGNDFAIDDISLSPVCVDTAWVTITVSDPQISLDSEPTTCGEPNGSVTASVSGGNPTYTYSLDGAVSVTNGQFNDLPGGNYTVVATDASGCSDEANIQVGASTGVTLNAQADPTTCGDINGSLTWSVSPANPDVAVGFEGQAAFTASPVTDLDAGTYTVIATDAVQGCADTVSVTVDASSPYTITIETPSGTSFCGFDELPINTNATSAMWSDGAATPNITADTAGIYIVAALDANGCPDTASVTLTPCTEFEMPISFSPNGDGTNDFFTPIPATGITILSFEVFDRWGQKVHTASTGWDGRYQGSDLPSDVYLFRITAQNGSAPAVTIEGDVTLLR